MYPDPYDPRPVDGTADMDPAAQREFFGPGGRRGPTGEPEEPGIVPELGNHLDKPLTPDPTGDRPLSTRHD